MVDFSISFDDQISAGVQKSLRILDFIKNVSSDFQSASTLMFLYKSLILPILTYSSSIWLLYTQSALNDKNIFLKNDYILAYKIVKRLCNSALIHELFTERSIS